ncbi:hypothetical protein EON83_11200 [bacterium]|nr:MAG: hypothetical protein EON83_11200 [bacterium]
MGTLLPGVSDAHAAFYLVVASAILPYLIALINQRHWSSRVRGRVAILICTLCAGTFLWHEKALSAENWVTSSALIFALSATLYSRFARDHGADQLEDVSTRVINALMEQMGAPPLETNNERFEDEGVGNGDVLDENA